MNLEKMVKGRKVCVTGGAGFIGSHLALTLLENNEVVVFDNLSTGRKENLLGSDIEIVQGELKDLNALEEAFTGVDLVFHMGANPSVLSSIDRPLETNESNVTGTLNALHAAKRCGVKKFVYSASSAAYGNIPAERLDEGMLPEPNTPYAVSKLVGEYYCKVFNDVYGLPTTSLRYFNVFGPRQDLASHYASVIPKFIKQINDGKKLTIDGDGRQTRDFVYVRDVVQANLLASMRPGSDGRVINVARGERTSILEVAHYVLAFFGLEFEGNVIFNPPRRADIKHSLADITLAKDLLGFDPRYPVKESIELLCKG